MAEPRAGKVQIAEVRAAARATLGIDVFVTECSGGFGTRLLRVRKGRESIWFDGQSIQSVRRLALSVLSAIPKRKEAGDG